MLSPDKLKKVIAIATKTAEFCGVELLKADYVKHGSRNILDIIISKPEGISTDDCEKFSKGIAKKLDELDIIKEPYYLEVSSPGTNDYAKHSCLYIIVISVSAIPASISVVKTNNSIAVVF